MRRKHLPALLAVLLLAQVVLAAEFIGELNTAPATSDLQADVGESRQTGGGGTQGGTVGIYSSSLVTCTENTHCGSGQYCVHGTCRSASTYCGDTYCDTGETCTSCSGDCGACAAAGGKRADDFVQNATEEEEKVEEAEDLITQAEGLIETSPAAAAVLLTSAAKTQTEVVVSTTKDVEVLDDLLFEAVEELGILSDMLKEGKQLMREVETLLQQAEQTTDLKNKSSLLKDAAKKQQSALELIPEAELTLEAGDEVEVTVEQVEAAMSVATSPEARAALESVKAAIPPRGTYVLKREVKAYKITNKEMTAESVGRSKITLKIEAKENLEGVTIVENIPKSVAQHVSELLFPEMPEILQADPIVKWTITELKKGEKKDFTYIVKKLVEKVESQTVFSSAVEEKPPEAPPEEPPEAVVKPPEVKPVPFYLVILVFAVMLVAMYFVVLKEEHRKQIHGKVRKLISKKPKAKRKEKKEEIKAEVEKISKEIEELEKEVKAEKKKKKARKRKK